MNHPSKEEWMSTQLKSERPMSRRNVVLYLRTATRGQGGGSGFQAQQDSLHQWALERGVAVLHTFEDEGISGHSAASERPGFCTMLAYCQKNTVDQVLIDRWDRFARSSPGCQAVIRQLQDLGISVRSISEEPGPCEWQCSGAAS